MLIALALAHVIAMYQPPPLGLRFQGQELFCYKQHCTFGVAATVEGYPPPSRPFVYRGEFPKLSDSFVSVTWSTIL
jgi:hypothetical protein